MTLIMIAPALPGASAADQPSSERLVVGLSALPPDIAAGDEWHGARVHAVNHAIRFLAVETHDPMSFRFRANVDPNVRYVEQDHVAHLAHAEPAYTPDDPSYASQYAPQRVRAHLAWDTTLGNTSAAVCIIDTGVRYTHEDIAGSRWLGGIDFVNNDQDPWDDQGHGTHVAASAAGTIDNGKGIAGIANVGVYGVKVLNSAGSGSYSGVANGITWCADNTMPRTVLSLSLGGSSPSQVLEDAVRYAFETKGKPVIAAAGNSGPCSDCVLYPAAYDASLAVGCTTSSDGACWFTSTGPQVGIAAPGYNVLSASFASDTSYTTKSGTSMSTPHVSGAAALYWSHDHKITGAALRTRLMNSALDLGASGRDNTFGCGRLDVQALFAGTSNGCVDGSPPILVPVYNESFDDGSLDGWTTSGLWRIGTCRSASAPYSLAYNTGGCPSNYNVGRTSGEARSPQIALGAAKKVELRYRSYHQTEGSSFYDTKTVEVAEVGGGWKEIDRLPGGTAGWHERKLDLTAYAGKTIHLRFRFDSRDSLFNSYEGWYVDDVRVLAASDAEPRNLNAKAGPSRGAITLGWEPPLSTSPSAYRVYAAPDCDATFEAVGETALMNFEHAGLGDAQTRCYRVTALSSGMESGASEPASATTWSLPGEPQGFEASAGPARGEARLSWLEGADGGAWLDGYRVYGRDEGGAWGMLAELDVDTYSFVETGLPDGARREYKVSALNAIGEGNATAAIIVRAFDRPAEPQDVRATFGSTIGATRIEWAAPADDGGTPLTAFVIERDTGSGFERLATLGPDARDHEDPDDLMASNLYRVRAVNLVGEGDAADASRTGLI